VDSKTIDQSTKEQQVKHVVAPLQHRHCAKQRGGKFDELIAIQAQNGECGAKHLPRRSRDDLNTLWRSGGANTLKQHSLRANSGSTHNKHNCNAPHTCSLLKSSHRCKTFCSGAKRTSRRAASASSDSHLRLAEHSVPARHAVHHCSPSGVDALPFHLQLHARRWRGHHAKASSCRVQASERQCTRSCLHRDAHLATARQNQKEKRDAVLCPVWCKEPSVPLVVRQPGPCRRQSTACATKLSPVVTLVLGVRGGVARRSGGLNAALRSRTGLRTGLLVCNSRKASRRACGGAQPQRRVRMATQQQQQTRLQARVNYEGLSGPVAVVLRCAHTLARF
jgi:hypothetical protein